MPEITGLEWDTTFFGIKTGKLSAPDFDWNELAAALKTARLNGYQLVYFMTGEEVKVPEYILNEFDGKLVDKKVIFSTDCAQDIHATGEVEEYPADAPVEPLVKLAFISGQQSRFKTDTNFPIGSFEKLYRTWITRSVLREIADMVYVVYKNDIVAGMMTISWEISKATIGLIAVLPEMQGNNLGTVLINKLKHDCYLKGIKTIEVATQRHNFIACNFYEKNGFTVRSENNIYHFWLA